jgi:protein gp37
MHCYAERMAQRLQAMGQPNYSRGFSLALHPHVLDTPLKWSAPQVVFVNSMSDLFHSDVPPDFILRVFEVMNRASWHRFQVLTKRSRRLLQMETRLPWAPNIWMGVTVEDARYQQRIDDLRQTRAAVKFLSFEPLLGPLPHLDLTGIDWVIVGGESGPGARPMYREWVVDIRDQCLEAGVPFFFKQWGGWNKKKSGRVLQGRVWNQMPVPSVG